MTKKYAIGVDVGATNLRVALGNGKEILAKAYTKTPSDPHSISAQILKLAKPLINRVGIKNIAGMGIGSGSYKVPALRSISNKLKIPVHMLNDCTAAVLGERFLGAGKKFSNLVFITISSGIGAGAVIDDRLLRGKDGNAAEIGHITIDFAGKLRCPCGKFGHWEAYCSGKGIPNFIRLWAIEHKVKINTLDAKTLFDRAKLGDETALEIVNKIGKLNAMGFAAAVDAYDPELITVGGAVALNNRNLILEPIKKYLPQHVKNRVPKIRITPLKDDITLHGAIVVAKLGEKVYKDAKIN